MKKVIFLGLLISSSAFAIQVCQNLTLCQDQMAVIQAQQAVSDRQAALQIAQIQAAINVMPSPSPSPSQSN